MIYSSSRFRCNQNQSSTTLHSQIDILAPRGAAASNAAPEWNFDEIWFQKLGIGHTYHMQLLSQNHFPQIKMDGPPPLIRSIPSKKREWRPQDRHKGARNQPGVRALGGHKGAEYQFKL